MAMPSDAGRMTRTIIMQQLSRPRLQSYTYKNLGRIRFSFLFVMDLSGAEDGEKVWHIAAAFTIPPTIYNIAKLAVNICHATDVSVHHANCHLQVAPIPRDLAAASATAAAWPCNGCRHFFRPATRSA